MVVTNTLVVICDEVGKPVTLEGIGVGVGVVVVIKGVVAGVDVQVGAIVLIGIELQN